ncbi:hypothetical protein B0H17DRAFT_29070 [Mycena rosella]|uniref:MYND-type domain-containing protein n=1 Tax=Mycena rosella TaxID=1033263 RepID=A0AAD7D9L5_MYCRO|nr:hypothetical protein B0H17DRAFT_29070 [Mycena rosella]
MEEPRPVVDIIRKLLASPKSDEDENSLLLLTELINAIEQCPPAQFPITAIEALLPYLVPLRMGYSAIVAEQSPADVFPTKVAGAAVTTLASIMRKYSATSLWPEILRRLVSCWPSICMGLCIYSRALLRKGPPAAVPEIDSPAYTFTSIVTLLLMYADIDALAALIRERREVTDLVIMLWVLEAGNAQLSAQFEKTLPNIYPPTAAGLLGIYLFTPGGPEPCLSPFLSALEGSPRRHAEIAYAGLEHLRRSTHALSQYSPAFSVSIIQHIHTNLLNLTCLHSTPLHFILLSQNSVGVMTETLLALASWPFDAASADAIAGCITQICEYLHKYIASDGLASLNHSLELGLLVGLLKVHPWLDVKPAAFDAFVPLLSAHLPRYLIYISVLRQVHKSLNVFEQLVVKGISSKVQAVWLPFLSYVRIQITLARGAELDSEPCNNLQCSQPSCFRCSGCLEAVYCSHACQTAAWTTHGDLCTARRSARLNGIPPDLAEEDVQFALRGAQRDFEQNKANIFARWTAAGTLPIRAGIDYSVFPHQGRTDTPSVIGDQVASDAMIYAVFPQGTAGTEYYMCDLGLTREAGATDDETIAAVVQMVGAQPVPAFFRIN